MRYRAIFTGLVMVVMLLAAFAALAVPAKAAADQPRVLYVAMQKDMPDFNTWNLGSNSVWKSNVISWGFESLFTLDYNQLPYPLLVENFTFDEGTLTVDLNLRQGVLFHDGVEMTADDVVFTYTAARHGTTYASNIINAFDDDDDGKVSLAEIEAAVTKTGTYSVRMVMAKPYGQFFQSTLGVPIMPEHVWYNEASPTTDHVTDDMLFDVRWNDKKATISTGPWKYKEGVKDSYQVMEKNTDYWGKDMKSPMGYSLYPPHVDLLHFKIYASIDTAILALQSGQVDYIAWAVTPGRVATLQADPTVGLDFLLDNGYFYLAFNQKLEPMNSLPFRRAVSHVINKANIVNVYLGGYAAQGTACQPPFWDVWYNDTVATYPYSLALAAAELDDANFTDQNDDGWRDMPDGRPMEKLIILTPPADYDPVRIRAGQAIATNLRALGINAEAKAIDFDTLVARMYGMDFQMLIIGWSLSSDPIGNVFDILGPQANQNTFGFWSDDIPNPFYSELLGVNTLADAETQAMADKVTELAGLARETFNITDQIKYTKWGQGVIADALPVNVLYYRVNIQAYSKTVWEGWMPFLGDMWTAGSNYFLMSSLRPAGTGGVVSGVTAGVNVGISLPGKVLMGENASGEVLVIDNEGAPISGATVQTETEGLYGDPAGVSVTPASGTTDANGLFSFVTTGTGIALTYVNVTAASGGITSNEDSAIIRTVDPSPKTIFVSPQAEKLILAPNETSLIGVMVTDESGAPIEGAEVIIDESQLGYGEINVTTAMTDATGYAEFEYSAPLPSDIRSTTNSHLPVSVAMTAEKAGYGYVNAPILGLMVYVDLLPDWRLTSIVSVTTTALSNAANTTAIEVIATDDEGNPLAAERLDIAYSRPDMVYQADVRTSVLTDGAGLATVDVQIKDLAESGAVRVTIGNMSVLNSATETVTLTFVGTTPPAEELYGGYVTYADPKYLDPLGALTATAYLWDSAGNPADGILVGSIVSGTSYGTLVWQDDINWDSTWDGLGINVVTSADRTNLVTSGPVNMEFNESSWENWSAEGWLYWDWGTMTAIGFTNGSYTFEMYGLDVPYVDIASSVHILPASMGFFNDTTYMYQIDGQTTISTEYVIGRSYQVLGNAVEFTKPVMTAKQAGYDSTALKLWAVDETGAPVEGAGLYAYQDLFGRAAYTDFTIIPSVRSQLFGPSSVVTDADGYAMVTVTSVSPTGLVPSVSIAPTVFVKAAKDGYISLLTTTNVIIHPVQAFIGVDPVSEVQAVGTQVPVTVRAWDAAGLPIPYLPIRLTVGGGELVTATLATDGDGVAVFVLDTSGIAGARAAFISVDAKAAAPAYEAATARATIAVVNSAPSVVVTYPAAGATSVEGPNVTVSGSVYDANGIQLVTLRLDGGSLITLTGISGAAVWDISRMFPGLADGAHTLVVNATDSLGISTQAQVSFTTVTPEEAGGKAGADILAWSVAAIGWIIAAILLVLMLMRKRKAPEAMMKPGEPEVETEEAPKPE